MDELEKLERMLSMAMHEDQGPRMSRIIHHEKNYNEIISLKTQIVKEKEYVSQSHLVTIENFKRNVMRYGSL